MQNHQQYNTGTDDRPDVTTSFQQPFDPQYLSTSQWMDLQPMFPPPMEPAIDLSQAFVAPTQPATNLSQAIPTSVEPAADNSDVDFSVIDFTQCNPSPTDPSPTDPSPTNSSPTDSSPTDSSPTDPSPVDLSPIDYSEFNLLPTDYPKIDYLQTNTSPTVLTPTESAGGYYPVDFSQINVSQTVFAQTNTSQAVLTPTEAARGYYPVDISQINVSQAGFGQTNSSQAFLTPTEAAGGCYPVNYSQINVSQSDFAQMHSSQAIQTPNETVGGYYPVNYSHNVSQTGFAPTNSSPAVLTPTEAAGEYHPVNISQINVSQAGFTQTNFSRAVLTLRKPARRRNPTKYARINLARIGRSYIDVPQMILPEMVRTPAEPAVNLSQAEYLPTDCLPTDMNPTRASGEKAAQSNSAKQQLVSPYHSAYQAFLPIYQKVHVPAGLFCGVPQGLVRFSVAPMQYESRVETSTDLRLILSPVPFGVCRLHLPQYAIANPKQISKSPHEYSPDMLELSTMVVCNSAMAQEYLRERAFRKAAGEQLPPFVGEGDPEDAMNGAAIRMCDGCKVRERKRIARRKYPNVPEGQAWLEFEPERSLFITSSEYCVWEPFPPSREAASQPASMNSDPYGSMKIDLKARVACYCRHQDESSGFRIIFTLKDHLGNLVAQQWSNLIFPADRH